LYIVESRIARAVAVKSWCALILLITSTAVSSSFTYLITRGAVVDSKVSASVEAVSVRDQLWKSKERMSGKKGGGEDCRLAGDVKI
jgi:hypothetical protein